jgi:hypothetical protein
MFAGGTEWRGRRAPKPGLCRRPSLEQLENRLAPAVYHVNTFQDTSAANLATGQDASGHVSLRAAVASAGANHESNTIVLAAGTYALPTGELNVRGSLQIMGQGAGQTVLDGPHLARLFDVHDGDLLLSGLTLNGGSAQTLLKGEVQLADSQITDIDVAALANALLAARKEIPVQSLPKAVPQIQPLAPQPLQAPARATHLLGQAGGGATGKDPLQELAQETHESFWRAQPEAPAEAPSPAEAPEDLPQSRAGSEAIFVAHGAARESQASPSEANLTSAWQEPKTVLPLGELKELWITRVVQRGGSGQAILLLLVVGFCSFKKFTKEDAAGERGTSLRRRRLPPRRRHNPPRQSRRTRGPPASGPPVVRGKIKIKQGRQRCLPGSF